jgi:hemerythrin-like domain-containing protein
MITITEALASEHVVLAALFEHIERVLPGLRTVEEARLLTGLVEAMLHRHSELETHLAYVALDHVLEDRHQLDRLHEDHEEIDDRLRRARSARRCLQARSPLAAALQASREHFRREEQTVFPLLDQVLPGEMLAELGQVWWQRHQAALACEPVFPAGVEISRLSSSLGFSRRSASPDLHSRGFQGC